MLIKLLVDGGEMKPGPAVSQKLGPMGINIGQVISKVNEATANFKGMKVPATLDVDPKSKEFTVEVSSPPTSELLKKELKIDKAAGDHKKLKAGNASIEQIISVAKTKHTNMLDKEFKSAVKSVAGSAGSLGILIEDKDFKDAETAIDKGEFDSEINEQKTETSPEKLKKLKDYFDKLHKKQEAAIEAAAEEAKVAEEAKAAKADGEEATAEGEAKPEAETEAKPAAAEAKPAEKK